MNFIEITSDADYQSVIDQLSGKGAGAAAEEALQAKLDAVRNVVEKVRQQGDAAVADFTRQFDGVDLTPARFEVKPNEIDEAVSKVDPELIAILERAAENIRAFHAKHLRQSWQETYEDGTILGQRVTPLERAGVYVPGGKAFYPSSVLMNIVPASVAGVNEIIMVSPPSFEGGILPEVLAAAKVAGATRVFRIGGAQAVAALAHGTETIPPVLKITGPGNIYVTLAKRLIRQVCEIDSEAGPSEVVVIADEDADPRFVAVEMLAQAEHDEDARSILLTPSKALAAATLEALKAETESLSRKAIIEASLQGQGMIIVTRGLDEAIALSNFIAPEHLSIQTAEPGAVLDQIENAGAVMLGAMTPVAVGDYYAGPNHILPTDRKARFASPLTAEDFRKVTSIISYSKERLAEHQPDICRLAEVEGLTAHARAVEIRT